MPQKEKLANPIDKFKKDIIETPDSVETAEEIEKIENDVKITEEKVKNVIEEKQLEKKKIIEQKVTEEIVEDNLEKNLKKKELILEELANVNEEISKTQTWMRLYELLPSLIVDNEKVKAAELDYEAAVEKLKKTYSAYYPQVTITYGHNWEDDRTTSKSSTTGVDSIKNDGKHGIQKSITITQMIWDFGRTNSLIDMEKIKAQQTYFHLELAKEDLIIEAISAWLNLMKT